MTITAVLATTPTTPAATETARLRQTIEWIIGGNSEVEIIEAIGTQWPGVEAAPLIAAAKRQINKQGGIKVEAARMIYQKAIAAGDLATGLRAKLLIELTDE